MLWKKIPGEVVGENVGKDVGIDPEGMSNNKLDFW